MVLVYVICTCSPLSILLYNKSLTEIVTKLYLKRTDKQRYDCHCIKEQTCRIPEAVRTFGFVYSSDFCAAINYSIYGLIPRRSL